MPHTLKIDKLYQEIWLWPTNITKSLKFPLCNVTRNDDLCSLFSPIHVLETLTSKLLRNCGLVKAGCNILPLARAKVVLERFINSALMYLGELHRIVMEREALKKRCCRRKFVFFSHSPV